MNNASFNPLDLNNWPRSQMFGYFSQTAPTGYSLTVTMDITAILNEVKTRGKKFFPAYLWAVTKTLNKTIEFKVAVKDGVLGYWSSLTPLYASFHDDDKTISFMWTEYSDNFHEFYERYLNNQETFKNNRGILSQPHLVPPPNAYTVSCLPWVEFQHFAVHSYDNKSYYFPSIEAGKFTRRGNSASMPLSVTAHHATTDGWHISRFLEDLQEEMNCAEKWV